MASLRMIGESLIIFTVSIIVLFAYAVLTWKKATGIGVLHVKGYVLMGVGVLYLVFGATLTRLGAQH